MNDDPTYKKPSPRWLRESQDFSSKARKSKKHEIRVAKELGGKRLAASGAKRFSKWMPTSVTAGGDLGTKDLLVEHKRAEPETKSIGVKREWLQKVTEGAKRCMKDPAMVLTFEDSNGFEQDWMLLPLSVAKRLMVLPE
jgi:hypothetical protein